MYDCMYSPHVSRPAVGNFPSLARRASDGYLPQRCSHQIRTEVGDKRNHIHELPKKKGDREEGQVPLLGLLAENQAHHWDDIPAEDKRKGV